MEYTLHFSPHTTTTTNAAATLHRKEFKETADVVLYPDSRGMFLIPISFQAFDAT